MNTENMGNIGRRDLLLLLIGVDGDLNADGAINGITRLQKYLYILEEEEGIRPSSNGFEFVAYKAGPYSPKVYDDLELLENLGLVKAQAIAKSTPIEAATIEKLSFDDLIDDGEFGNSASNETQSAQDSFEEKRFALTDTGKRKVLEMIQDGSYEPCVEKIRIVKSKFTHFSLGDLLYYVYTRHPEMTTESEIIDSVLGRD